MSGECKFGFYNHGRTEDVNSSSVYRLLTKLCQRLLNNNKSSVPDKTLRRCRSKAFEILLSKKIPPKDEALLPDNDDPYCHLLAWQFILINEHNLAEYANQLQRCINILQYSSSLNKRVLSDILYVLLKLCRLPEQNNVISIGGTSSVALENCTKFRYYDVAKFKLTAPIICKNSKFNNESFLLQTKRNIRQYEYLRDRYSEGSMCQICNIPIRISCSSSEQINKDKDEYESLGKVEELYDVWGLASKTEFTDRRTWETLGNPFPDKELPFLSEASSNMCSNLYNMHTCNILQLLGEGNCKLSITVKQPNFISHVKHLLVGITSDSFKRDDTGEVYLVPGTTIEGITPLAMESYSADLILCSCCYSALDRLCNLRSSFEDHQSRGFIFKELCDSINRYLAYYRLAVQNISERNNLLSIHNHVRPLLSHLTVLASVCKVGPFRESGRLPNGVSLLNYLYQKTVELTDKDVVMVLYSVLYPCIQMYFNRFLQLWIFEGVVIDPYDEFFIVANTAYLRTRGRTYWTRSYTVRVDMVPDFLSNLTQDIYLCGKTVNLLKSCVPNSPLCMYLLGKKPNLLSCCLSSHQVSALERNSECYYLEVMVECGPKFQLGNFVSKNTEQQRVFVNLVTRKRTLTLKRLELEKLKRLEEEVDKKHKAANELRKQYDKVLQDKKSQLIRQMEQEIKSNEEILKMQSLRKKLIAEETSDLMGYYEKLDAVLEQKHKDIQKHIDKLKRIDLDATVALGESQPEEEAAKISSSAEEASIIETAFIDKSIEEKSSGGSNDTFVSASSDLPTESEEDFPNVEKDRKTSNAVDSPSLDIINANSEGDTTKISEVAQMAAENFEIARRNRAKVLTEEMGMPYVEMKAVRNAWEIRKDPNAMLSALERNRLKVMSSEFDLHIAVPEKGIVKNRRKEETNSCFANKRKVMGSSECFYTRTDEKNDTKAECKIGSIEDSANRGGERGRTEGVESRTEVSGENKIQEVVDTSTPVLSRYDNEDFINTNINRTGENGNTETPSANEENGNIITQNALQQLTVEQKNLLNRSIDLRLDFSKLDGTETIRRRQREKSNESIFSKFLKSPNFELDKPIPMSLGSTPCIDAITPRMQSSLDKEQFDHLESAITTAATNFTDEGFDFDDGGRRVAFLEPVLFTQKRSEHVRLTEKTNLSKRVSVKEASAISTRAIKIFIQQSVSIPLNTQIKLVNNELLKYFFHDLQLLTHLNSLRNYFFLLDGEFGRNITEGLFEKLHDVNFPADLINYRTLQHLVYNAIDSSIKQQENSNCLSFKINSLPKSFNLEDPDVLECLSLSYKVTWPLNILLPSDAIAKYDEVFKFLLKLHRVSWVLKKILQELKLLSKKSGRRETYLVLSPQFQKLHQNRHIMTHFVQTLQNYVVGEVLQTSWHSFEKKLISINNIDEVYVLHVSYIKNILFTCLLNQRSYPIRKLILKIFTVILKFYNYLRATDWAFDEEDCVFEHPNFKKLEDIFRNFEEFAIYFVKAAHKVARVGYQPHLMQLLDMLNINDYYTRRINVSYSPNNISNMSLANASL